MGIAVIAAGVLIGVEVQIIAGVVAVEIVVVVPTEAAALTEAVVAVTGDGIDNSTV